MAGLSRNHAVKWMRDIAKIDVSPVTAIYWERRGLLRDQTPGRRIPANYYEDDLVWLRVIAELRRGGAPFTRIELAIENLQRMGAYKKATVPQALEFSDQPGREVAWQFVVDADGGVHRVEDDMRLDSLPRGAGRNGWYCVLDFGRFVEEAAQAIREQESAA